MIQELFGQTLSDSTVNSLIDEEPIEAIRVETNTLDQIIAESPSIDRIGYLNIDCEGHDFHVLKGVSIDKYRPLIITIEAYVEEEKNETISYLAAFGYSHQETLHRTLLFVRGVHCQVASEPRPRSSRTSGEILGGGST